MPTVPGDFGDFHDSSSELQVLDDTYADDSIFFGALVSAARTMENASTMAHIVVTTFADHQLKLNTKRDKSEFMIKLRGPGAKAEWERAINEKREFVTT